MKPNPSIKEQVEGIFEDLSIELGSATSGQINEALQAILDIIDTATREARIEEIDILRNGYSWGDALEASEYILDDRLATLQEQSGERDEARH